MRNLMTLLALFSLILFSQVVISTEVRSFITLSSIEDAKLARSWLAQQDLQDGISKDESILVGGMYWHNHQHERRFIAGALGEPEDHGQNWFIPYHYGAAAKRSNHGVLINKLSGVCSHPKLKSDLASFLLEKEIEKLDRIIVNMLLKNEEMAQELN